MAMVSSSGRTVENTRGNGKEANSMESVFTEMLKEKKEEENGLMVKGLNG